MSNAQITNLLDSENDSVIYLPNFYTQAEADSIFNQLSETVEWRQDKIKIFGKIHNLPRLQAWYGDENATYKYSNISLAPLRWTELLIEIKSKIENISKASFNSVLLNLYRNGQDSNGWHSDDEKELGLNPVIASLTFGAERQFQFKHKKEGLKTNLILEHGSLLIMSGTTQHNWKHQIPKTQKFTNPRLNLTFRRIIN